MGFFDKLKAGLSKTKNAFVGQIDTLLKSFVHVDEALFEELEELLICADVGVGTADRILTELRACVKEEKMTDGEAVRTALREILTALLPRK